MDLALGADTGKDGALVLVRGAGAAVALRGAG